MTQGGLNKKDLRFPKIIIEPIRHLVDSKPVGVTFEEVLAQLDISLDEYHHSDFTMSADEYLLLHRRLKHQTKTKIDLKDWLSYYSATSAGLAGMATLSANTIRDALMIPVKYMPLYMPALKVELIEGSQRARLSLELTADLEELNRFLIETVTGVFNIISHQVTSKRMQRTIHFKHACTAKDVDSDEYKEKLKEYEDRFGYKVIFNSYFNGLEGDSRWLSAKTHSPNEATFNVMKQLLDNELAALESQQSFATRVQKDLSDLAVKGYYPSLEEFADRFNLSSRTFIRKLAKEGTAYKTITNDVWFTLAKDLLRTSNLSVKQIAGKTGFKSVNSFSRAFKSLANITPAEWRKSQLTPHFHSAMV
ncbi:MAG: AraC family transcriptional regulator [Pseudomonadales bacterium]|nr:AraC family transcriptional regulator [Pseudomonadales bacterium]